LLSRVKHPRNQEPVTGLRTGARFDERAHKKVCPGEIALRLKNAHAHKSAVARKNVAA
jgi:hypothetical protein